VELQIATTVEGSAHILRPAGEIDLATRDQLSAAVDSALASGATAITLDLSAVTFMDSTGLGTLVAAHESAAAAGVSFGVTSPQARIARVLGLTGMDHLIQTAS
jgi:anti-sigma B factor antagonist